MSSGTFGSSGGGQINNPGQVPRAFSVIGCGVSNTKWTFSGGSGAYFTVYAPNHQVVVSGGGEVFGAIAARRAELSGGTNLHVDTSLFGTSTSEAHALVAGGWSQLLR